MLPDVVAAALVALVAVNTALGPGAVFARELAASLTPPPPPPVAPPVCEIEAAHAALAGAHAHVEPALAATA